MPKTTYEFKVEVVENQRPNFASSVYVTDPGIIDRLLALGYQLTSGQCLKRIGEHVQISDEEGSPRLAQVLQIVASLGHHPYPRGMAAVEMEAKGFFSPRRIRTYNRAEVRDCEWLTPRCFNWGPVIGTWTSCIDGRWQLMVDKRQKNQGEVGQADVGAGLICTQEFVTALQETGMKEARWEELHYDKPDKVIKHLGMLSSSVIMPPCLTPRQNAHGYDWKPEDEKGPGISSCHWDDAGYVPEELKFDRAAVEQLGKFNLAITREQTGNHTGLYCHTLVVSQRFRKFVEQRKVRNTHFVPVRLV